MLCELTPGCGLQRRAPFPHLPLCGYKQVLQQRCARRITATSDNSEGQAGFAPATLHGRAIGLGMALALSALQAASVDAKPATPDPYQVLSLHPFTCC